MPFKTSMAGPGPDWSSGRWFRGILAGIIVLLLSGILGFAFHEMGKLDRQDERQDSRLDIQERKSGIIEERIDGIRKLIDERTRLLESKLDNLRTLIEARTER